MSEDQKNFIDVNGTQYPLEIDTEKDGRYIAEITNVPSVMSYGDTPEEALQKVNELLKDALREAHTQEEVDESQS